MMSARFKRAYLATLAFLLAPLVHAAHLNDGAPPVPAQVLAAKTVFVSNRGLDAGAIIALAGSSPNVPFQQFYAALHSRGRLALVAAPAAADLVFEFHVDAALFSAGQGVATYSMFLTLTVLDPKTHVALATLEAPLQSRLESSVNTAVTQLLNSFEALLAAGNGTPSG